MWVKDVKTGEVADLPVEQIKAWPGSYVPAEPIKQKSTDRSVSKASTGAPKKGAE